MPRKIIVYIATSADGYIARPDGDFAWLNRPPVKGNYGIAKFYRKVDTVSDCLLNCRLGTRHSLCSSISSTPDDPRRLHS